MRFSPWRLGEACGEVVADLVLSGPVWSCLVLSGPARVSLAGRRSRERQGMPEWNELRALRDPALSGWLTSATEMELEGSGRSWSD
jgi:hypothetical protein